MDDKKISNKLNVLNEVFATIEKRKKDEGNNDSYVSSLLNDGLDKILSKIKEECDESIEASENGDRDKIIYEYTDLLFHMMVGLSFHNVKLDDIYLELERRIGKKKKDYTLDE
tara:strand:+ start:700 stop:1038 length:339 start_codon:yes stop_codon:yes gene_type:complete